MPSFTRFQEQEHVWPSGQIFMAPPGAMAPPTSTPPSTPAAPDCTLPTNPRAGQPGVQDPYFSTSSDRDAWIAAHPSCAPPPAYLPDTPLSTINLSVVAPAGQQLPGDLAVTVDGTAVTPSAIAATSAKYSVPNLPDGSHALSITGTGYQAQSQQVATSGGQIFPVNVTLQPAPTGTSTVPGYPSNYAPGPVFGDQSNSCAQLFFQFLQANAQFRAVANAAPAFNNPAAQAIGARTGMSCTNWLRMSPAQKHDWVSRSRYGTPIYKNSPQVNHLVRQMNASCGVRPAGQAAGSMPQPAWTYAAYGAFANANPACSAWAEAAAQQFSQYTASTGVPPPAPPPAPPVPPAQPSGPSFGKVLLVLGVAGVAIWGLSKMAGPETKPVSAPEEEKKAS